MVIHNRKKHLQSFIIIFETMLTKEFLKLFRFRRFNMDFIRIVSKELILRCWHPTCFITPTRKEVSKNRKKLFASHTEHVMTYITISDDKE